MAISLFVCSFKFKWEYWGVLLVQIQPRRVHLHFKQLQRAYLKIPVRATSWGILLFELITWLIWKIRLQMDHEHSVIRQTNAVIFRGAPRPGGVNFNVDGTIKALQYLFLHHGLKDTWGWTSRTESLGKKVNLYDNTGFEFRCGWFLREQKKKQTEWFNFVAARPGRWSVWI